MKFGEINHLVRFACEPEKLDQMIAWEGTCKYCQGVVKMFRSLETFKLFPDSCSCFSCGQRYYMEIADIKAWEKEQWEQKEQEW